MVEWAARALFGMHASLETAIEADCRAVFRRNGIARCRSVQTAVMLLRQMSTSPLNAAACVFVACKLEDGSCAVFDRLKARLTMSHPYDDIKAAEMRIITADWFVLPMTPMRWADRLGYEFNAKSNAAINFAAHTTQILIESPSRSPHKIAVQSAADFGIRSTSPSAEEVPLGGIAKAIICASPAAESATRAAKRFRRGSGNCLTA